MSVSSGLGAAPGGVAEHQGERQALLSRLLSSVKCCQSRFGRRGELATESSDDVKDLCATLEDIFSHGLHRRQQGQTPWSFVKTFLSRHELERYYLLKAVTCDRGRIRAWLRAALNEHSLEKYLLTMLADKDTVRKFYEAWSFLSDQERSSVLPSMAAGLSPILFAIKIDSADLNAASAVADGIADDQIEARRPLSAGFPKSVGKKKKKKKSSCHVVSIVDDGTSLAESVGRLSGKSDKQKTNVSNTHDDLTTTTMNYTSISLLHAESRCSISGEEDEIDVYSRDSRSEKLSLRSSESQDGDYVGRRAKRLTPLRNSGVGALIPVSLGDCLDQESEDSISVRSYGDESDYANAGITLRSRVALSEKAASEKDGGRKKDSSHGATVISREDLKQALLSVMERKDQLQELCTNLKKSLTQETAVAHSLREELSREKRRSEEGKEKLNSKVQALSRENELLKHQLKKYVGAVQKLRDGPQAYETLAQLEDDQSDKPSKYVDYHFEASEYEKKLIQVAEMHGELIEFNDHLQRTLLNKDLVIQRMKEELVDLRGPLPNEGDLDDAESLISESAVDSCSLSSSGSSRALLHIWIPSVFLSGSGSKTHHVYQVYLRIRDEEWNIYRRYSDFYNLHVELKKQENAIASFDFPPKKTVGYKAEKVVEDRKKRLQTYLRQVVNLVIQTNPALWVRPNKESILLLMPFFAENAPLQHRRSGATRSQSQPRSIFNRRHSNSNMTTPQLAL